MAGPRAAAGRRGVNLLRRRRSLRVRLLLGLIIVVALGLGTADLVIYGQITSYLNRQVDTNLTFAAPTVKHALFNDNLRAQLPLDSAVEVVAQGGALASDPLGFHLQVDLTKVAGETGSPFSATGTEGGVTGGYRVLAIDVPIGIATDAGIFTVPGVALIAIPLSSVAGTQHQLLLVELAVSLAVLAVLAALGYGVVRVGLRPLEEIGHTAEAIAAGDLSRRVERDDPDSEVGRLGRSLNAMLSQIEEAFSHQRASEDRLRQFLADASHELRTPVTSIRGYSELFRRGAADRPDDLAMAMRRIEEEAIRMGVLVDDLLLLARLDEGRPLARDPVDLAAIVTDAVTDAQVLAPERAITLAAPEHLETVGDEQRLRQVVANLLQNALRYTPPASPIEVRVEPRVEHAELVVADHGPGVDPEHLEHVFERFYRAERSRTRESGGSGLGLSIVASIVAAHGGTVRVERTPGGGASFIVDLPLEAPAAPPAPPLPAGGGEGVSPGEVVVPSTR